MLSICFAGGYLGAALFNIYTAKMELLRDIPDLYPGYEMLTSLVCRTEPHMILVSARQDQTLLDCVCVEIKIVIILPPRPEELKTVLEQKVLAGQSAGDEAWYGVGPVRLHKEGEEDGGAVRVIQPQVRHTAGEVADEGKVLHGGHSRYFNAAFFLELSVTLLFATAFSKSQKLCF